MVRPNFTDVERKGGDVRVTGVSDKDTGDIVDIQVVLAQGAKVARKAVAKLGSQWDVEFTNAGFAAGPAVAFGVETRRENARTTTWAQALDIP
jgi:hypothetical protein